jgi:hypothetical protein
MHELGVLLRNRLLLGCVLVVCVLQEDGTFNNFMYHDVFDNYPRWVGCSLWFFGVVFECWPPGLFAALASCPASLPSCRH